MEAIILAGGFGTRLSHIVKDLPKPMASVADKPFLEYILNQLNKYEVKRIILAVGYKKEYISEYFGNSYKNMKLIYSGEDKPLFTGGAVKKALNNCQQEDILIINGDTFFDINITEMMKEHMKTNADVTIAAKKMFNYDRYGSLETQGVRIVNFKEKIYTTEGLINGGVYILKKLLLEEVKEEKFSLEVDFFEKKVQTLNINYFESNGYFIDIGVEDDYIKAQTDFRRL